MVPVTGDPRSILLVQLDHLGDALITTAMLPPLRRQYPRASIEVLAGPWNRQVFDACPEVDRVHVSRVNRFARGCWTRMAWWLSILACGWSLRRRKFDLAIDVRGEFPLALILWLCGARRRVGWACGGGGFLLTDSVAFVPGRPEVESRLALLDVLGIRPRVLPSQVRPRFHTTDDARRSIARQLALHGPCAALDPARDAALSPPLIVLHIGAGTAAKQWPPEHWQELLGRLVVGLNAQCVLVGGPADRTLARRILDGRPWPGVWDWTGRLSLLELAALLERADAFVGADSGPAHLAAAVDAPAVVLFSGTNNPVQWQPRGPKVVTLRRPVRCSPCHRENCPWTDHPCMQRLRPAKVFPAVSALLAGPSADCPRSRASEDGAVPFTHPDPHGLVPWGESVLREGVPT